MRPHVLAAVALLSGAACFSAHAQQPLPPQLTYVQPLSQSAVKAVQQQLRDRGDYRGRVDGIWGPDSLAALQRFQATHGLQVTGTLNEPTVASLGLNPSTLLMNGTSFAATGQNQAAPGSLGPGAVRAVQERLTYLGFYNGPIDGIWGPDTQTAIARFQQSRGLQPNSQLNAATVAALGLPPQALASQ